MAQSASATFITEREEAASPPRPDLRAATGIMTGLAISAGFWVVIGYVFHVVTG
jgi:hypothetical protein